MEAQGDTSLPGVGRLLDFITSRDERVAVVTHRSGERDLVVYGDDPDACRLNLRLGEEESRLLAELLLRPLDE